MQELANTLKSMLISTIDFDMKQKTQKLIIVS